MNHADHLNLLRHGIAAPGGVWADFGSGTGAFTLALAELIGPAGEIFSIDKDEAALRRQAQDMRARYPEREPEKTHYLPADFTLPLDLPPLDGAVMANALHFQRNKEAVVNLVGKTLRPGGTFILVEYNVDQGNFWVPYPLSFTTWENLARRCGFRDTRLLAAIPSRFLKEIYSASSMK